MIVHACICSIQETEAGGKKFINSRLSSLHSETVSEIKTNK